MSRLRRSSCSRSPSMASPRLSPVSSPRPAGRRPGKGTAGGLTESSSTSRTTGSRPSPTSIGCRARCSSSSRQRSWRSSAPRS
uniref:Uncharacterized protein n=1 Tax=Setaria italica TaxID=4555 RepID=K4A3M8_SETIT